MRAVGVAAGACDGAGGGQVDAYTCSWRPTLLYLASEQLPTVLSFLLPHEPLWTLEILAVRGACSVVQALGLLAGVGLWLEGTRAHPFWPRN